MEETAHAALSAWESFYVIVGSSAAALTGLQFVVIALVAEMRSASSRGSINAFGTPTIVHFCAVLLIAAIVSSPWTSLGAAAVALAACGAFGLFYAALTVVRARRQSEYQPVLEDWLWHAGLPFLAHGVLVVAALRLPHHAGGALFAIGGASLLLLFVGIHNAWDTVTWIAIERRQEEAAQMELADTDG